MAAKFLRLSIRKSPKDTSWDLPDTPVNEEPQSQAGITQSLSIDDPPTVPEPITVVTKSPSKGKSETKKDPKSPRSKTRSERSTIDDKASSKMDDKKASTPRKKEDTPTPSGDKSKTPLKSSSTKSSPSKSSSTKKSSSRSDSKTPSTKSSSKKVDSSKLPDKGKNPSDTPVPKSQRDKRRSHRRRDAAERENPTDHESEDARSQGFLDDGDWSEGSSLGESDDFVGGYDFKQFEEDHSHDQVDFSCLSPEDIVAAQKKQISSIAELLVISASAASNLLRSYGWQSEKLLAKYFDNPDQVMKEAGLFMCGPNDATEAKVTKASECLVCTDVAEPDTCCAMTCGHIVCHDCWSSYLTLKINEGEVYRIRCPSVGCNLIVPDELVKKLVDRPIFEKYLRFVTKSFVEDNSMLSWCPFPGCRNAITTEMVHGQIVQCACNFRFCFSCHHEAHAPATCDQVRQWTKKCSDDSETGHWLGANTKPCPRCDVYVEKNGGCNHMTCRQCGYEWCWLCIKVWKGHEDFYACTRYEKAQRKKEKKSRTKKVSKIQAIEDEREAKRLVLERYMGYYDKFLEYDNLNKHANLREKAQARTQLLQSEQTILAELKFIEKASETVVECLETIKYSYVFGYFLEDGSTEKAIFTILQEELIKTTLMLKEVLESPSLLAKRTETVDLTKIAQKKKDNMLAKGV